VTVSAAPSLRTGVVLALALVATFGLMGPSDAASGAVVPGSDPRAQALLERAVAAENTTAYAGVEFMTVGDDGSAIDVVNVTHLPGKGTVLVEDADNGTPVRAAFSGEDSSRPNLLLGLLGRSYRLVMGKQAEVAGRPALQVVAERADGSAAARFWIDTATGLLLRRDIISSAGQVVRRSEFVQLALSASSPRHLPVMLPALGGRPLDDGDLDDWRGRGWPCPRVLGGLSLFDARTVPDTGDSVLHLSYSDGLSTVSVFVQSGRLGAAILAETAPATVGGAQVRVRPGEPRQILWSTDGHVITVVADAPAETVAAVVAGLPHHASTATGWSRVERGVARVVSWFNPFA
jgi:sigma-E factor negative regulatory protein RseB